MWYLMPRGKPSEKQANNKSCFLSKKKLLSVNSHSSLKFFLNHVVILLPLLLESDVKNIANYDNKEFTIYVFLLEFYAF